VYQDWQHGIEAVTTEMFVLAHAKVFLSAGDSFFVSLSLFLSLSVSLSFSLSPGLLQNKSAPSQNL
jgi:hypothetical protein